MRTIVLTALVLASAAQEAAAACPSTGVYLRSANTAGILRSAVVACGRAERVVVDRAALSGWHGERIVGVARARNRVAWSVLRYRGRTITGAVRVAPVRRPARVVRRLAVLRERAGSFVEQIDVALTTRGELAWAIGRQVRLQRHRGGSRELVGTAERSVRGLAVEDDRTLRWNASPGGYTYVDLRPWPGGGCPRRERFTVELRTPGVIVSRATYGVRDFGSSFALRACDRGSGAERIVGQGGTFLGNGSLTRPLGATGTWLALLHESHSRYRGCEWATISTVDVATGAAGRSGTIRFCNASQLPDRRPQVAVTDRHVPAWIAPYRGTVRVLAAGPDGEVIELDRAGTGSIAGLRADGPQVTWTHDGQQRWAEPG